MDDVRYNLQSSEYGLGVTLIMAHSAQSSQFTWMVQIFIRKFTRASFSTIGVSTILILWALAAVIR